MTIYRFSIILTCMLSLFLYTGCEKNSLQTTSNETTSKDVISTRTIDDCDECPVGYCCCAIQLGLGTNSATLDLCGAYDPTSLCSVSPPSGCSTINSNGKNIMLNSGNLRELFCVPAGNSFSITNNTGGSVNIRFTCHYNVPNPIYQSVTLADTEIKYFRSDGDCFLEECM